MSSLPSSLTPLLQPDIYPHPVCQPITLIQTHASYLFLTGDYVYKVKKSVNFGFLNYSTLAARKHFCEEELRLNRRTAPDLYLGVVCITQVGDRVELNGEGDPIDYAVKMKQFPQDGLFSEQLRTGQLTPARMRQLATAVTQLHRSAATNPHIRTYGSVEQIRRAFDESYAQTQVYVGRGQTEDQLRATQAYTDARFAHQGDYFLARVTQDKIRECHGDLHLGNICLWNDRVFLFDAIEFNDAFRYVDTMYDVAFVVMDCTAQGRPDLGIIFLNEYLEQTGDWEGLSVLGLYLCRQAYVRAKVTSFLLDDPTLEAMARQAIQSKAAGYYRLAWQYTLPRQGRLILMSGLSGSGKSTVARYLAPQIGAIQIRSDAVRKHLAGIELHERGEASLYSREMSEATYARLLALGLALAQGGETVILDATYDRVMRRRVVIAAAIAAAIPVTILVCEAPADVIRDRLRKRRGDIADATVEVMAGQQTTAEALTPEEKPYSIRVDTTGNLDEIDLGDTIRAIQSGSAANQSYQNSVVLAATGLDTKTP